MQPWITLERVATPDGPLELRQRGSRDFIITIAGRILMTSVAHRSEDALARLACEGLGDRRRPRVLLGGLGMGYTLRAALDVLPPQAAIAVVDLNACVFDWCRGPLAGLTDRAVADRRVKVQVADVARVIADAGHGCYDAILLDLYEGPHQATNRASDPLYGASALRRAHTALRPGGVLAVWSEEADQPFETRFGAAGFRVSRNGGGKGGRTHFVYVGSRIDRRP